MFLDKTQNWSRTGERSHASTLPWGGVLNDSWELKQPKPGDVLALQAPEEAPNAKGSLTPESVRGLPAVGVREG